MVIWVNMKKSTLTNEIFIYLFIYTFYFGTKLAKKVDLSMNLIS